MFRCAGVRRQLKSTASVPNVGQNMCPFAVALDKGAKGIQAILDFASRFEIVEDFPQRIESLF
jgi:hypothetical protein